MIILPTDSQHYTDCVHHCTCRTTLHGIGLWRHPARLPTQTCCTIANLLLNVKCARYVLKFRHKT